MGTRSKGPPVASRPVAILTRCRVRLVSRGRMFFIEWDNGQPCLRSGPVIEVGKKRKQHRVEFEGRKLYCSECDATPKAAIERQILWLAFRYGEWRFGRLARDKAKPWLMSRAISKLRRLAKRFNVEMSD